MRLIRRIYYSPLVRGSFLIFIAQNFANFGNFIYNLSMGRLLGPKLYGDLGSLFSTLIILSVPLAVLNLLVVKKVASFWGKKNISAIRSLFSYLTPRLFFSGIIFCTIYIILSPILSNFLQLDNVLPVVLISFFFILNLPITANRAVLQGTLSYSYLAINSITEISLKVIVSVLLVFFNLKLTGALLGPLVGTTTGYILSFIELKFIFSKSKVKKTSFFDKNSKTVLISLLLMTLSLIMFVNMDIILVKHFFTPFQAGEYVALSTVSKIIYYAVGPVIIVMFPTISSRISSGLPYILPLLGTLVVTLGVSSLMIFINFFFPKLVIGILFGAKYYGAASYLGIFSFFITIFTVNSILTHFFISVSYYKPLPFLFLAPILQTILMLFFHQTISQIIWINIFTSLVYFFIALPSLWIKEKQTIIKLFHKALPLVFIND